MPRRSASESPPSFGELERAVEDSLASMTLTGADAGAMQLARTYAGQIDAVLATGDPYERTKALYLGPHLLNALSALGGTPAGRKAASEGKGAVGGQLAQLREVHSGRTKSTKGA